MPDLPEVNLEAHCAALEAEIAALRAELTQVKAANGSSFQRTNRALRLLLAAQQLAQDAVDETELLQALCDAVIEVGGYSLAWVGYAEATPAKTVRTAAACGQALAYLAQLHVTWDDTETGRGPVGTAIRTGAPAVLNRLQGDPRFEPWQAKAAPYGFAAVAALPLQVDGALLGALTIYATEQDAFDTEEVGALLDAASAAAHGLEMLRARQAQLQAETALQAAQEQTRLLAKVASATTNAVVITDPARRIQWVNDGFTRLTGYTFAEVRGRNPKELLQGPETDPATVALMHERLERGEGFTVDSLSYAKDGHTYWVHIDAEPLFDDLGQLTGFMAIESDITAMKQMLANLAEKERRLRSLVDTQTAYLIRTDLRGNFIFVNQVFLDKLGFTAAELLGTSSKNSVLPADWPAMYAAVAECLDTPGVPVRVRLRKLRSGGRIFWTEWEFAAVQDETGAVVEIQCVGFDITDRMVAEQALRASEARFRAIFADAAIGIASGGFDGRTQHANRALQAMLGYSEAELQQLSFTAFTYPEDVAADLALYEELFQGKRSAYQLEKRYVRKDGSVFWARLTVSLVRDEGGQPQFGIAMVEDIDARKQAVEELRLLNASLEQRIAERTRALELENQERKRVAAELEAERDFARQIMETMGQGLVIYDRAGNIEYVNPYMSAISGYTTAEIIGTNLMRFVDPADRGRVAANLALRQDGVASAYEFAVRRIDGAQRYVLVSATPRHREGVVVGAIAVVTDLTERRHIEEALRASEARYHSVVSALTEGVVLQDDQGNIIDSNASARRILGLSEQELEQKEDGGPAWSAIHEDGSPFLPAEHPTLVALVTGEPQIGVVAGLQSPGDSPMTWLSINAQPLRLPEQTRPYAVVTSFTDITPRKQIERALLQRAQDLSLINLELAKVARLKDEFLANMSHELRTPLTGILALSEALRQGVYGPVVARQARSLEMLEESGLHLLNLINDVLDLSKVEAGRMELQLERIGVSDVCQASLRMVRQMATQKQMRVQFAVNPMDIVMVADAKRLKQILVNLLSNAVKFTGVGGIIGLEVVADAISQQVRFVVWDNGIGIAAEQFERLFQPFVQLESGLDRQYMGTGLGLALVRRLVELHEGEIHLASTVGQGSRFTVTLPWKMQAPKPAPSAPDANTALNTAAAGPTGQPARILVAEDNPILMEVFEDGLRAVGYHVTTAANGVEAMARVQETTPDLIVMDIQMPGMDGLEVIRNLRTMTDPLLASVPILAVTAHAMAGDRERCLAAGADDYLSKPIALSTLAEAIARHLTRRQPGDAI